jgi:hypothetical protein
MNINNLFLENISLRLTKASSTVYFAEREKNWFVNYKIWLYEKTAVLSLS